METKLLILLAMLMVAVAACSSGNAGPATDLGQHGAGAGAQAGGQAAPQRIRLADTPYMQYAYLLSDNESSQREEAALAGFQVSREPQADGSLLVTLTALQPGYHDQRYTVQQGQQLYFIETSMGDDRGTAGEYNLGDDTAVLVDGDGYILR